MIQVTSFANIDDFEAALIWNYGAHYATKTM